MSWHWTDETLRALGSFLADRGLLSGQLTTRRIGDGHSNLTYLVSDGNRQVIVRRPPPPPSPPGAHDVLREARFLTALQETTVPAPRVLATAQAGEILDVPLYVMSYIAGPVVTSSTPAPLDAPTARAEIGASLIDTMVALHAVDWRSTGLADAGRPAGFNARHLRTINRLVADDNGDPPPRFAPVFSWLTANTPGESGDSIIHCDFRLGNVVLAPEGPGRVAAVLDWELATIGDPLLDLGYFLATVPEAGRPLNPTAELGLAMCEQGYPTRSQLADRYASATGRDLSGLRWYTTLALWKLAVLYDYSGRRAASGHGDPYYDDPRLVPAFLQEAEEAIEERP
ncbi:phosphotransferase family protein [Mycolicibacterium pyrenivorans]|uniref:phosphotransferase family protein n=1 Tax=Mycolicibacterium pyrenivorans TaxID=187102 RepID=UPI0021F36470|nr:phosphotransferase family protein [Mycolicibacterium pyrenivorans]MCV7154847.1 phosphotransferase family protein [Mycolicibacterium pyrenivorans]